ncbi:F-actin-capping protein subunit alpha [Zopfochytrium polystomum]|nr:F-actin-capping protein subunit alpha [Zopfochytrium polystomum]
MDDEEKKQLVRSFIMDAPPGEINDVFNDVRVLLEDDDLLQDAVTEPFRDYNTENHLNITSPAGDYEVLITKFGEIEPGRYVDPRSKQSFIFDHVRQEVSHTEPFEPDSETEPFREAVEAEVDRYLDDHYPDGIATVYGKPGKEIIIAIVDNKFNPNNFWNGRWTSHWSFVAGKLEVNGTVKINVHYYEDGNVQLQSTKDIKLSLSSPPSQDPAALAAAVVKAISKAESDFQVALNESYAQLSDSIFKSLRRALPVTRTKVDWGAISNYKIGAELANK